MVNNLNLPTSKIVKTFSVLLFLTILVQSPAPLRNFFCHSDCIAYTGACFDVTPNSCYVCADSLFVQNKDFTNPYNPCALKDQRRILFKQLDSNAGLSLDGYSTSNRNIFSCSNMSFSGRYINSDYIEKNFTDITTEHFELVIRFNVGYIGNWGTSDRLQLQVHDGVSTSYYAWEYTCGQGNSFHGGVSDTQNLCSIQGTDCVKIKEFTIQHNSSYVYLKWTALTSQNDVNVQSWGIKDLTIGAKTCHRYCDRCFGEKVSQCLTCAPGFFLRGNTCVQKCPRLSVPQTQECVDSCPSKYYHNVMNNFCEPCLDGCSLCSGSSHCLLWQNDSVSPKNALWYDKMELWIIMIIGGVAVIGLLLWKFLISKYFKKQNLGSSDDGSPKSQNDKSGKSSNSGELNNIKNTAENLTNQLWVVDAENLDPVKVDVRRRKKRKADFDQTMNNSEMQL